MSLKPHCPACGAPLPETKSPSGVICEYCGVFIRAERPSQPPPSLTQTDRSENDVIEVIYPERNPPSSEPEINWDAFSQWRGFRLNRWRTLRRSILGTILIVVVLLCFSCLCLLGLISQPLQQFFNSFTR
jgi:uncharacterized Zn finger protein (UPF0148 family)